MQIVLLLPLAAASATGRESNTALGWPSTVARGMALPPLEIPLRRLASKFAGFVRSCAATAPAASRWYLDTPGALRRL